MDLDAYAVDWDLAVDLAKAGRLDSSLTSDEVDLPRVLRLDSPMISPSFGQYLDIEEAYRLIVRGRLSEAVRERADRALDSVINDGMSLPSDLPAGIDSEIVAGSLAPDRVRTLASHFAALDYDELARQWDEEVYDRRPNLAMSKWASETAFTGYLKQWEELLSFAAGRGAGVLVTLT